jgi:formylglycine-generating enzyme required for sulfatase activity
VRVSWQEAAAFCNWLSEREKLPPAYARHGDRLELIEPATTGYRLPSEAEWEFAARFDGARATRKYPWGNDLPVPAKAGNWGDATAIYLTPVTISGYDDGFRVAAPVGSFPANPLGLNDMGGNVFEWTTDRYSIYVVGPDYLSTDPVGPKTGDSYVIRGAGWLTARRRSSGSPRATPARRGARTSASESRGTRSDRHEMVDRARYLLDGARRLGDRAAEERPRACEAAGEGGAREAGTAGCAAGDARG